MGVVTDSGEDDGGVEVCGKSSGLVSSLGSGENDTIIGSANASGGVRRLD